MICATCNMAIVEPDEWFRWGQWGERCYHYSCWKRICVRCHGTIKNNYSVINLPIGDNPWTELPIFLHHACVDGLYGIQLSDGAQKALDEGRLYAHRSDQ